MRTGKPSLKKVVPEGFWQSFAQHPEEGNVLDAAMAAKSLGQVSAVIHTYDMTPFTVITDIRGGRGQLLQTMLQQYPQVKGLLFALPHVLSSLCADSDRLRLQPGDFFRDSLPSAEAYLLMDVIHDWNDEHSLRILSTVRRAAPVNATLLLIESLVPENFAPDWAKTLDIFMLVLHGGLQRSCTEYQALLANTDSE